MEEIEKYKWNPADCITLTSPVVFDKYYDIDFDKVQTLDDVKNILKHIKISVHSSYHDIDSVRHLLKYDES